MGEAYNRTAAIDDPIVVEIAGNEIVLMCAAWPFLTARAARETGRRLIDAASRLDNSPRPLEG